jgi:Tfp pilus assembly protein PilZ
MKKIIYWILGIVVLIILIIAVAGFIKFNFTDSGDILPDKTVWGEAVLGDLDADGDIDKAVWIVEEPGGSGTFFYAQLFINNDEIFVPTNKMFLGDRIAPQNINIMDGRAVYNFAERKADEPMTTPPSIGKSIWIHYDKNKNQIGEWVKDFEGEEVNKNIHLSNPIANTVITSPLVIKGEARGPWFFEASFPVFLTDWDGLIIAEGIATAEGE